MPKNHRQEKLGAILSYTTFAFNIITGLIYIPLLIRTLGVSDYGLYTLSASIIGYFVIDFGIGAAQTRFIARFRAEGREEKVKDLAGITAKLYIIIDALIFCALILVYIFSEEIFANLTPIELERFKVIFLISSLFVVFNFPLLPLNGIFVAYKRIVALKLFSSPF